MWPKTESQLDIFQAAVPLAYKPSQGDQIVFGESDGKRLYLAAGSSQDTSRLCEIDPMGVPHWTINKLCHFQTGIDNRSMF